MARKLRNEPNSKRIKPDLINFVGVLLSQTVMARWCLRMGLLNVWKTDAFALIPIPTQASAQ